MFRAAREEQRKKIYKKGVDPDQCKSKRTDNSVTVRKQKRLEQLNKRRTPDVTLPAGYNTTAIPTPEVNKLPQMVIELRCGDVNRVYAATVALRKLLSLEVQPPISQVIEAGVVPDFITILDQSTEPKLQFEAAWALTNIASGTTEQTIVLIRHGAVEVLVKQLHFNNDISVKEQCVWAIGNIAGDSSLARDYVLDRNVLQLLLELTKPDVKTSLRRNVVWAISNLCRGKPAPRFEIVAQAVPTLSMLIQSPDPTVITDACWALSYLSDGDNERIKYLLQQGVCAAVVRLLTHELPVVQTPALRVIGNIVTGDDLQTQAAIESGCLLALKQMLDGDTKKSIKREVCWTLSNITAGTVNQITAVIQNGVVESLIEHMIDSDFDIRKEAAWAIANATSSGQPEQIHYLVKSGCLRPLCDLVNAPDVKVVAVSLEGLENILACGEKLAPSDPEGYNPYAREISKVGGYDAIDSLVHHPNLQLREKAKKIIDKFFDQSEDQNIGPNTTSDNMAYAFGTRGETGGYNF